MYEYTTITAASAHKLQVKLNDHARQGWRAISGAFGRVPCLGSSNVDGYMMVMERKVDK